MKGSCSIDGYIDQVIWLYCDILCELHVSS